MRYNIIIESDLSKEDFLKVLNHNVLLYRLNKAILLDRKLNIKETAIFEALEKNYNDGYKDLPEIKNRIHPNFVDEFRNLEITKIINIESR
ncbi:MAG: hypothetical protein ACRCW9_04075 [Cetobacterium sp.]